MKNIIMATIAALIFINVPAQAKHYHKHKSHHHHKLHHQVKKVHLVENGTQFLPHPTGCPRTNFCACGASVRLFGRSIRALWPSVAWLKMPYAIPAPEMVAARRGHVFVLESHVAGNNWVVSDYNSGGHMSRRHIRSIAGYRIVNPHGAFARLARL